MSNNKHLYTASELFYVIVKELQEEGRMPDILEYALPTSEHREFRDYGFDVLGRVNYGGSEGIYLDLFYNGIIDNRSNTECEKGEIGTIKTLEDNDEAFRKMAVLMADFQIKARSFINAHLDDFTWNGFNIRYYEKESDEQVYGVTKKRTELIEDAVSEAKRTLEKYPQYVRAVIISNSDGRTRIVTREKKMN